MDFETYERGVLRTANNGLSVRDAMTNVALGLTGEAGEFADMVKKAHFHGHQLDGLKAAKELGDILFYVAWAANELGWTLEDVAQMNADKLAARYPNGFSSADSIARRDVTEKPALCGAPTITGTPCVGMRGHNMGRADVPTNHISSSPLTDPRLPADALARLVCE